MKPYSKDLRLKVLDAVDRGMDRREVAEVFGVSLASIKRWLQGRRETGDVEARSIPGPPARKGAMLAEWPPAQLRSNDDLTLDEHCEAFEEDSGVKVSRATMCRTIARLPGGWPLKKVPRSRRARRGGARVVEMAGLPFRREEARLRGRGRLLDLDDAPGGEGAEREAGVREGPPQPGQEPDPDRLDDPGGRGGGVHVQRGGTDAPVFEAYVEEVLAPSLAEGQVVVLDSLGAHRTAGVRELVEARGCELVFLPSYSPDLNPIEEAFSKIKNLVRKAAERTREGLNRAIAEALEAVTLHDVAGWFAHCGCYESRGQYS